MPAPGALSRDEKVENLVINFSMIMMGMFEGVFTAMASTLASTLTKTAEALTEAMDEGQGSSKKEKKRPTQEVEPEVAAKMKDVFAGLRNEVAEGFSDRDQNFKRFTKDPSFDEGVRIVERHPLTLPMLTEHLTDADLARYVALIQAGDPEVSKMMQELGEWQNTTPKFEH